MVMNGAESLVRTLVARGVNVCFTNPGTSEMHFVSALDRVDGMRCVLCLFEGVATGAADGYARMAGRGASTLLHLGPGLANGLANLHNTRRARSPVINIVGEHATFHRSFNAPLTADIETLARPVSSWVRTERRRHHCGRHRHYFGRAFAGRRHHLRRIGDHRSRLLPDDQWGCAARLATTHRRCHR